MHFLPFRVYLFLSVLQVARKCTQGNPDEWLSLGLPLKVLSKSAQVHVFSWNIMARALCRRRI